MFGSKRSTIRVFYFNVEHDMKWYMQLKNDPNIFRVVKTRKHPEGLNGLEGAQGDHYIVYKEANIQDNKEP